jgi:hypothetical protein
MLADAPPCSAGPDSPGPGRQPSRIPAQPPTQNKGGQSVSDAAIFGFAGLALALAAAVVAIWQGSLLRKELQHSRRSTVTDLYFRVHSAMLEVDKFFVDRPELRPYFYENKRLPRSKRELDRLDATAEMLADLAESVVATVPRLEVISVGWNRYFAFLYKNSEVLRRHWRENSDYYPDSVREAFQAPRPSGPM